MALSNRDRVGKALELLNKGLRPFIERELKATHGSSWESVVRDAIHGIPTAKGQKTQAINWDTQALLAIMEDQWQAVFTRTLGKNERTLTFELRDVRNKWARQEAFTLDDPYRALDSVQRLLTAVTAGGIVEALTDSEGRFTLNGVPAGLAVVQTSAAGYLSQTLTTDLVADGTAALVTSPCWSQAATP